MKPVVTLIVSLLCLLAYLSFGPGRASAQTKEDLIERILKPLPEYDPFDKPAPAPQFFPDEVDKRVREALVDSLTNRHEAL
ncbi:MAG: hypothetical protein HYY45_21235, partial [Deltaproteobacteria bacterium]|nr:hypothetical protein [Deltaproteobacteria bacterium]